LYINELAIFFEEPLETQPGFPELPYIVNAGGLGVKAPDITLFREKWYYLPCGG
jgi:hypothetical protein